MRLSAVPFHPRHLEGFPYKAVHLGEGPDLASRVIRATEGPNKVFTATILDRELPIAVVGLALIHEKAGECWSVMSTRIASCGIPFTRMVRRIVDTYERQLGLQRMQILARSEDPGLVKWCRALGFQFEGRLRAFGHDGADYSIFGRTANRRDGRVSS